MRLRAATARFAARVHQLRYHGTTSNDSSEAVAATFCLGIPRLLANVPRGALGRAALAHPITPHHFDAVCTVASEGVSKPATMLETLQRHSPRNVVLDFNRVNDVMTAESMKHVTELVLAHCTAAESLTISVSPKAAAVAPAAIAHCAARGAPLCALHVHLDEACCGDEVVIPVISAIARASALTDFSFSADGVLGAQAIHMLLSAIPSSVTCLELPGMRPHGDVNTAAIADAFQATVATSQRFPALQRLDLSGNALAGGHRFVARLCTDQVGVGHTLRSLDLSGVLVGEVGLTRLGERLGVESLHNLCDLHLAGVPLSDYVAAKLGQGLERLGARAEAGGGPPAAFGVLGLGSCSLSNAGLTALARGVAPFREVILRHNRFGHEGAKQLAAALEDREVLERLILHSCPIGDAGAKAVLSVASRGWPHLRELDLTRCRLSCETLRRLGKALPRMRALESLRLARNDFRYNVDEVLRTEKIFGSSSALLGGGPTVAAAKSDPEGTTVNVRFADAPFFRPFMKGLAATGATLRELDMSDCAMNERMLQYFTEPLGAAAPPGHDDCDPAPSPIAALKGLRRIALGSNQLLSTRVGAPTVVRLVEQLQRAAGASLVYLDLGGINLGEAAGAELAAIIPGFRVLEHLLLPATRIGDRTLGALAEGVIADAQRQPGVEAALARLCVVDLGGNLIITPRGVATLLEALANSRDLQIVNVSGTAVVPEDVPGLNRLTPPLCRIVAPRASPPAPGIGGMNLDEDAADDELSAMLSQRRHRRQGEGEGPAGGQWQGARGAASSGDSSFGSGSTSHLMR